MSSMFMSGWRSAFYALIVAAGLLSPSMAAGQITNPGGGPGGSGPGSVGPKPEGTYRFAAFGDYGQVGDSTASVAAMVRSWDVDGILALGDNNYFENTLPNLDNVIGRYYHDFIGNYIGDFGVGSPVNRFFPVIGNHDWWYREDEERSIGAYKQYFTLPGVDFESSSGNERYYDFVIGNVHFFAVNSYIAEPDGRTATSAQAMWLKDGLAASQEEFNIVYFHEPPYNSGWEHGDNFDMKWPFDEWGVDAVICGHEHIYERLSVNGVPYFTSGLGGVSIYGINQLHPASQTFYTGNFGSMLISAQPGSLLLQFYSIDNGGTLRDQFLIVSIPEPGGLAMAAGLGLLGVRRGRRDGRVR